MKKQNEPNRWGYYYIMTTGAIMTAGFITSMIAVPLTHDRRWFIPMYLGGLLFAGPFIYLVILYMLYEVVQWIKGKK